MTNCSAPSCKHNSNNCNLYRFPTDISRRRLWMKKCGRQFATTDHRLCKHHFKEIFFRVRGGRRLLVRNAIPTIFKNIRSQHASKNKNEHKMRNENKQNDRKAVENVNSIVQLRISNCWSEQDKDQAKKELWNAIYENSNPLDNDPMESEKRNSDDQSLGLENIPITGNGNDISMESHIKFSYSTPKNLNDLTPILEKWSPKINNVTSIIEDLIDSSDDEEDQRDEETGSNHVVYIDEDLVKQEEFVDENSDEEFDCESNKSSKKEREELNGSFDDNKMKQKFHITDTLRIKLPKIDVSGKLVNNHQPSLPSSSKTTSKTSNKKKSSTSSNKRKKLSKKPSCVKKSSKNISKSSQRNLRNKTPHTSARFEQADIPEPKLRNKAQIQPSTDNKRQSLRLSGKSPEIKVPKLPDVCPLLTRSGKKRIYEEPNNKSVNAPPVYTIDDEEVPHRVSRINIKKEPRNEETSRSRSLSPSAYKHSIEVMYVCQCCEKKYASVEQVKAHIRTHFPNCLTN